MAEKMLTMKDFDLGVSTGQINNKEEERVYIEKANAKAALKIIAAKKAKKESGVNQDVQKYIGNVKEAIKNNAIPLEIYEEHFDDRIAALNVRIKKLLSRKDQNRGFLAKSDTKYLEELQEAVKDIKKEKEVWLKENKKGVKNANSKDENKTESSDNTINS